MKYLLASAAVLLVVQTASAQDAVIPAEPLIPLEQWFHPDDYPPASMRGAEEGDVSALLTIDAQGMVTGCHVTRSSGHPMLDRATCALAVRRGRFIPAKDAQRQPVVGSYVISEVRWRNNGIGAPSGGPPIVEVRPPATLPVASSDDDSGARAATPRNASTAGILEIGNAADAQQGFVQNQTHFRAALDNMSTSPSFILITVIDGRSGTRRTGCTMAGFLLHAIATEEGIYRTDYHGAMLPDAAKPVKAEALASKDHVYTFRKAEALATVPTNDRHFGRACDIIHAGLPAYMQDRSAQIVAGWPPGEEPKP